MKNLLYLLCALALLISGCEDKKGEDTQLNVNLEQLDFTSGSTSQSFDISANTEWTVTPSQSWCTVSPSSGTGNTTVKVTPQDNSTASERTAVIKVKDKDNKLEKTITVVQAATKPDDPSTDPDGHSLNVSVSRLDFLNDAGSKTVQITANVAWAATSSDQAWCTVSPSNGTGSSTINVTATANSGSVDRIAKLTIINSQYSLKKEISVTQAGIEPSIVISPTTKEIGADISTFDVTVSANVEFDVTPEDAWIIVTQTTATKVSLQAGANTTSASRIGKVTFKQKGGGVSVSLTVTQAGIEPSIVISPTTKEIGADAVSFDVAVSANVEFDVMPEDSWITKVQATTTKVTLQAEANTGTASRTGKVSFKQKDGSTSVSLTVIQAGKPVNPDNPDNISTDGITYKITTIYAQQILVDYTYGDQYAVKGIKQIGFCWGTKPHPTVQDSYSKPITVLSAGGSRKDFSCLMDGKEAPGTDYYIRMYAVTIDDKFIYFDEKTFQTVGKDIKIGLKSNKPGYVINYEITKNDTYEVIVNTASIGYISKGKGVLTGVVVGVYYTVKLREISTGILYLSETISVY